MNLFVIRHGETAWSLSGQHTGRTDIPLTDNGRRVAQRRRGPAGDGELRLVLVSPLQPARETAEMPPTPRRTKRSSTPISIGVGL